MKIQISGQNIDLGQALPQHIDGGLDNIIRKYFKDAIDARVVVRKNGQGFLAEIHVHVNKYISADAHGDSSDAYVAFQNALEKASKILRRKKRKYVNSHRLGIA